MKSTSGTLSALAPEWIGYKLNLEMTTLHSSKHLDILKDIRDMPILQPTLITSPSSNRNLSVNNQKIADVGECHTPQNT